MHDETQAPAAEHADESIATPERQDVPLDEIHLTFDTQARVTINWHIVNEYAEAMAAGAKFPPVVLFRDAEGYWVGDGHHRCHAAKKIGTIATQAEVRQGGWREAFLYACGANTTHGLRRSAHDQREVVWRLLTDKEWGQWSDREIARRCKVSHPYVGKLRAEIAERRGAGDASLTGNVSSERTYTTKHGTVATMDTTHIGSRPEPHASANGEAAEGAEAGPSKYQQAKERKRARERAEFEARLAAALAKLPRPFVEALQVIESHIRDRVQTLPPERRSLDAHFLDSQLQSTLHMLALQLQNLWETYIRVFGEPPEPPASPPEALALVPGEGNHDDLTE